MKETLEFLRKAGTFYLATVDGDQPRVRPFGAIAEIEGKLYTCTNNTKPVFKQIKQNPKAEISAMAEGKWIRLKAELIQDNRLEARRAMLDVNPGLRDMYQEDDGIFEVLYFRNATATICSFTEEPVVYKF